jgi:hypothetical protein
MKFKPCILTHATITSAKTFQFLSQLRGKIVSLRTAYTDAKSLQCCQRNTLSVAEIQCRFSFVCIQLELQGARNVTYDCALHVLQVYHKKDEIYLEFFITLFLLAIRITQIL